MAVIDSYSDTNQDSYYGVNLSEYGEEVGQSFACSADLTLTDIDIYARKTGSPTGNSYIDVYAHTGTYGTSSLPTGAVLATSDAVPASSYGTSYATEHYNFSGGDQIALSAGVKYVFILRHTGGDISNCIQVGIDSSSPSHGGNAINSDGVDYYSDAASDLCFVVNGEGTPVQPSVVDTATVAEGVSASVGDLSISKVETVSLAEHVEMYDGILLEPATYDSVGVSESITAEIITDCFVSVSESISVAENTELVVPIVRSISVYENVFTVDTPSVNLWLLIRTDAVNNPKAPTASLTASFGERWGVDVKAPIAEVSGRFGTVLDEKAGVSKAAGTISSPEILSLNKKSPISSLFGQLGSLLISTAPVAGIEVVSYSNNISLDVYAPASNLAGTCYEEGSLSLAKTAPLWTAEITAYGAYIFLDKKAPLWKKVSIGIPQISYTVLDEKAPVWKVEFEGILVYDPGITIDANAPVGTMREDTGYGDTDPAVASYSDRLEGYTLEFSGS